VIVNWSGTNHSGQSVSSGVYLVTIRAVGVEEREGYHGKMDDYHTQKILLMK